MDLLLFYLLGIVTGWLLFDKFYKKYKKGKTPYFSKEYFNGLRHVINEEQDKAILIFTQILANNPETVEPQIALGALYRRRGESAKAISVHKSLIEGENLSEVQKKQALFELGRDYMKAGMLDRAIIPFDQLKVDKEYKQMALTFLVQIYDQENDWDKALLAVKSLIKCSKDNKWNIVCSHYYCEKAIVEMKSKNYQEAFKLLAKALKIYPKIVRAKTLQANIFQSIDDNQSALEIYKTIIEQQPVYIPRIITPMLECYNKIASPTEIISYLQDKINKIPSTSLVLAMVKIMQEQNEQENAEKALMNVLQKRPTVLGLEFLISLNLQKTIEDKARIRLKALKTMMAKLREEKPTYVCKHCGFQALELHWQCPSCRSWDTIRPIIGVSGE